MKYDVRCLADDHPPKNHRVGVSPDLADGHQPGDRIKLRCRYCGVYGPHEVRRRLEGLARD